MTGSPIRYAHSSPCLDSSFQYRGLPNPQNCIRCVKRSLEDDIEDDDDDDDDSDNDNDSGCNESEDHKVINNERMSL